MDTYRLFAAIRPPGPIIDQLMNLQTGIDTARWSDAVKLHITLGFFGDVNGADAERLDESLASIRRSSFELSLSGSGHFGKSEPHSIWVGVQPSKELNYLHKAVKSAARTASIEVERRDYRPHVTLAYLSAFPDIEAVAQWEHQYSSYESQPFLVDEFFLYSSRRRREGSNIYEVEASYPLLG